MENPCIETRVAWKEGTYLATLNIQGPPLDGSQMHPPASPHQSGTRRETIRFRGSDSDTKEWLVHLDYAWYSHGSQQLGLTFSREGGHVEILEGKASVTFASHPPVNQDCLVGGTYLHGGAFCTMEAFVLPAENFEIYFTVKYKRTHFVDQRTDTGRSTEEGEFRSCYAMLFESGIHSDMVFTIGDQKVRAHKGVLSAHVPYFASMMSSGMKESETSSVEMDAGIDVAVFKESGVYRYFY